ncbi:MAG: hypothetical protein ABWY64_21515 [Tardiphaga sp.]
MPTVDPADPRITKAIEKLAENFMEAAVNGSREIHRQGIYGLAPQIAFQAHAAALAQVLLAIPIEERAAMMQAFIANFMGDVLGYYNAGVTVGAKGGG